MKASESNLTADPEVTVSCLWLPSDTPAGIKVANESKEGSWARVARDLLSPDRIGQLGHSSLKPNRTKWNDSGCEQSDNTGHTDAPKPLRLKDRSSAPPGHRVSPKEHGNSTGCPLGSWAEIGPSSLQTGKSITPVTPAEGGGGEDGVATPCLKKRKAVSKFYRHDKHNQCTCLAFKTR